MSTLLPALKRSIETLLGSDYPVTTDVPPQSTAWLAVPVFGAAKRLGVSPADHAKSVAATLADLPSVVVSAAGGFVNIEPSDEGLHRALSESGTPTFGVTDTGAGQTVVIEFSAPNIAKPMGVGHLRSTIIGDALRRLYAAAGYRVVAVNHLGDWGTQFGNLAAAYQQAYGDLAIRDELTVERLLELYVGFHDALKTDDTLKAAGQAMFRRLESHDPAVEALWRHFVSLSQTQFEGIYERLGVVFDDPSAGESRYQSAVPDLIERAVATHVAVESEGALVIPIEGETVPLLLRKSDGTTIYAARDLAAISYRVERYDPNAIVYVVANEQALHFRQVFAAAKLLGLAQDSMVLTHVKFGLVRTEAGKMSTRRGTLVELQALLDEAVRRAYEMINREEKKLTGSDTQKTAEALAIGALKYFDLSHDRNHDIVFDWDRMLSLKGDSAPYLQYSYVRAINIIRKAGDQQVDATSASQSLGQYTVLIRTLSRLPLVVEQAVSQNAPHLIAQYLNLLASQFHLFYEQYPVLAADDHDRAVRLQLVSAFANVMRIGLDLLGIETVESM